MVTTSTSAESPIQLQVTNQKSQKLLTPTKNPINAYCVDESFMRFSVFMKEIKESQLKKGEESAILFGSNSPIICWYKQSRLAPINEHQFILTGKTCLVRHNGMNIITIEAIKEGARRLCSNPETGTLPDDLYIKLEYRKSQRPIVKIGLKGDLETEQ